jgi:hypothetical protein
VSVQAAKVPLEVNQPVTGTVKFIAHYPDKPSTQEEGKWPDGNPKFKWVYNQPVRISKRKETGGKKVTVTITRLTELPATGAVSPPPAASPSKGSAIPVSATVAPVAVPPQDEQWDALRRNYERAAAIATEAWDGVTLSDGGIVAAAATIFIEANKRGLTVPAPHKPTAEAKATAIRDAIDKYADKPLPIQKGEEEDDLPFS